jgi:hypothetical protein
VFKQVHGIGILILVFAGFFQIMQLMGIVDEIGIFTIIGMALQRLVIVLIINTILLVKFSNAMKLLDK